MGAHLITIYNESVTIQYADTEGVRPQTSSVLAPDQSICIKPTNGSGTRLETALMAGVGSEATGAQRFDHSQGEAG